MLFNSAHVTFWFHIRSTIQQLLYSYHSQQINIFHFCFILQEKKQQAGNNKIREKEQEDKLSLNVPESSLLNLSKCRSKHMLIGRFGKAMKQNYSKFNPMMEHHWLAPAEVVVSATCPVVCFHQNQTGGSLWTSWFPSGACGNKCNIICADVKIGVFQYCICPQRHNGEELFQGKLKW